MRLGNYMGPAVPGEPLRVSAAIWQSGGADDEVHPVKVTWQLEDYCADAPDRTFDFGQTVSAPTLNTDREFPVVNASITLPATPCANSSPKYFLYACTQVMDDPTDTEICGSYNGFVVVPSLPNGPTGGGFCGDASGASRTEVMRADPVNTATGTFTECFTDAQIPAPGMALEVKRTYSSGLSQTGVLGRGWRLLWEVFLELQGNGDVVLHGEGGAAHLYAKESDGTFATPAWARSSLAAEGTGYRLTTADHRVYSFSGSGRLVSLKDRSGNGLSLTYTGGHVSGIKDAAGRTATLTYAADRLEKITLADGRAVDYGYVDGRLTSVTALDGAVEAYGYDADGRLATVTDAVGNVRVTNVYDGEGRVTKQVDALGNETTFTYRTSGVFEEVDVVAPDGGVWTDVYHDNVLFAQLDPFGNVSSYRYDQRFNRTRALDAEKRLQSWEFDRTGRRTRRSSSASDESWTYDNAGNIASYEDGEYNESTFGYNTANQLISVEDSLGNVTTYSYGAASGLLTTATSPLGHVTSYDYDAQGNRTSVTTAEGSATTFTFDAAGRVKTVTGPRGNVVGANPVDFTTSFVYDEADRVTSITDARGNTTKYSYDVAGRLSKVTDTLGRTTIYTYDAAGRLAEVVDSVGHSTRFGYDKVGRVISVTDRTGATTTFGYDKAGRKTTLVTARGNATGAEKADFTWTIGYDKSGNRVTVTDPVGETTAFAYDADHRPVATTNPLGHTREVEYDDNGNVTSVIDALGHRTTLAYDDTNRLISSALQGRDETTYEYDDDGNLVAELSPLGERTSYGYNADGRRISMVDPRGNVTGVDPKQYTWTFGYDAADHITSVTDPLGNQRSRAYDAIGNLTSTNDAQGIRTTYTYDPLNRVASVTRPAAGSITYGYDAAGFLTTKTDANGHVTTFDYDAEGRRTSRTDPLNRTVASQYGPEGHLRKVTNARGQTIALTTDPRGLATKIAYSDGTPATTLTYDAASRPVEVTDATGTRALTYDADNKLTSITSPGAPEPFQYRYNGDDTLKYRYDPQGDSVYYRYDDNGRVTSQRFEYVGTTTYQYDAAGNLSSAQLPTATARSQTWTYDAAGRLASSTTPAGAHNVTYDANGRVIVEQPGAGEPTRYAYDTAGRLTRSCTDTSDTSCLSSSDGSTYSYDPVGNLTKAVNDGVITSHTYDTADQLTRSVTGTETHTYAYDADGNQTRDGPDQYTYDSAGRIKTATIGNDTYELVYDADGNRSLTKKNGTLNRVTRWDINNPLPQIAAETSGSGGLHGQYQYGPTGLPQSMSRTSGEYYFTHDRKGSVQSVYDAAGTENYRYTYDDWGNATGTAKRSGGQSSPFTYTGQYADPSLPERLLLRARSYDSVQHRFTSTDPLSPGLGNPNQSPYNYAGNDPINKADPSGLCPPCASAAIGGVIGGLVGGLSYALTHQDGFSWGDFAAATGKGVLIGAGAGLLAPVGGGVAASLGLQGGRALATTAAVDAGLGMGYTWAVNTVQCQPTTPDDLLLGALGGVGASLTGPAWRGVNGALGNKAPNVVPNSAGITFSQRAIVSPRTVFRGDGRSPSDVWKAGFQPRGSNTDIGRYALYDTPSAWIGTSASVRQARNFPQSRTNRWVYEIARPGQGISVNRNLGGSVKAYISGKGFTNEREVIFPQGIEPSRIRRAVEYTVYGSPTGRVETNPGFIP